MPTGTISVNALQRIGPGAYNTSPTVCSMILLWTSKSADSDCLQKPHQLTRLPIYVDFLPALESLKPKLSGDGYEHNFFVVPKRCNLKPLYMMMAVCMVGGNPGVWLKLILLFKTRQPNIQNAFRL